MGVFSCYIYPMEYPGNPTKLTTDQIIQHYKRSGLKPLRKLTMNSLIRENYLSLREAHAFYVDLIERSIIEDDGGREALRLSYEALEEYIDYLNAYDYT